MASIHMSGQETQVSITQATDNTNYIELSIRDEKPKLTHIIGLGFEANSNTNSKSLYAIGGIEVLNRLQLQVNLGYEVKGFNDTVFYYANKVSLRTDNGFLLGVGFDNQNRGLFSLGYQFY